jgi:CheY-like chemotaxis protein/nitrogen-specific signal transduction histidine kinase
VWVETYNAPVFDDRGAVIGTVGFARDITDRKLTEQAREAALAEARRLAQVRSDFLANMSHEIRTPLNAVLGLAQAGARDVATRDAHPAFNRILDAGRMLLGVVDDILDFSKIEAGKLELESAEFRVGDVIDRAIALFAPRAAAKGLDLRIEESAGLPDTLSGDALRLSQILVNLLSNAVKFTEHGTVSLLVEAEPGGLHVAVEDSGIGMSARQLDRLFQPFEQADGSTTRRFGGTGLGLAISKRLLDLMHGTIDVASRVGGGARFDLHIPFADGRAAEPVRRGTSRSRGCPPTRPTRIADALQARGMTVTVPDEAAPTAVAPDLVVVDLAALERVAAVVEPAVRIAVVCPTGWRRRPARILAGPGRRARTSVAGAARARGARRGCVGRCQRPGPRAPRRTACPRRRGQRGQPGRAAGTPRPGGAQLVQAANGRLAVERFVADGPGAYDVVLTDIQMPEMDGYETTRRLHAIAPGLPVIGLTAHAMSEERDRCLAAGMVEHVAKPIDLDRLVAVLRPYVPLRAGGFAAAPVAAVPSVPAPVEPVAGETLRRRWNRPPRTPSTGPG